MTPLPKWNVTNRRASGEPSEWAVPLLLNMASRAGRPMAATEPPATPRRKLRRESEKRGMLLGLRVVDEAERVAHRDLDEQILQVVLGELEALVDVEQRGLVAVDLDVTGGVAVEAAHPAAVQLGALADELGEAADAVEGGDLEDLAGRCYGSISPCRSDGGCLALA